MKLKSPSFKARWRWAALAVASLVFLSNGLAVERFAQLTDLLPTPTEARLASGAPGPGYWQQEANYTIEVELDEANARIRGNATIEYINHSPHTLSYVWLQLDQNAMAPDSKRVRGQQALEYDGEPTEPAEIEYRDFRRFVYEQGFEGGYRLTAVADEAGRELPHVYSDTNLRVDLPEPLGPGQSVTLNLGWEFNIVDEASAFRHGRKKLEDVDDYAYHLAQWYPRMAGYYDRQGWQVKPYIGSGEFALEFGDFDVSITVPEDFIVAATGELANADEVLSEVQRERLESVSGSDEPVFIVNRDEATANLEEKASGTKTWVFKAERVRDFSFAASRGYLWDARSVSVEGDEVLCMSAYPPEAIPLWERYSTEAVALAIDTYSEIAYPYPYPVAWSAWGPTHGMEYPMISFQTTYDIDEKDTYSLDDRNYVIGVIVHEIGHNWFPMIINSDERQWMWMDEGLNSFVESIAENRFDPRMAERIAERRNSLIERMATPDDPPIMVAADSLTERGYQAYGKPMLGLTLLRESIVGRERFDFAFREYAKRWAFKRPTPADFFRTIEDASGVDLDWFWRGWFFGNDHVDMAIVSVKTYQLDPGDPGTSKEMDRAEEREIFDTPPFRRARERGFAVDEIERLQDWYYTYDRHAPTEKEREEYAEAIEELEDWEKELLSFDEQVGVVEIRNVGGLVMPLVLDIRFEDGSERRLVAPAEIWRFGDEVVTIPFLADKPVVSVELDRDNAFADADLDNNRFPRTIESGRFQLKESEEDPNPMREALYPEEEDDNEPEGNPDP